MIFIRLITLLILCCNVTVYAAEIDFMVLNMKGKKETKKQWKPLAQYLEKELSQEVSLIVMPNSGFVKRSPEREILLTNPVSAVIIEDRGDFEIIATLNDSQLGTALAGVIIVHKNSSVKNIKDLAQKKIGVVNLKSAAGGFLFQANQLIEAGLVPEDDFKNFVEMFNQQSIVRRVLQKQLDAGFIRTGMIESLSHKMDVSQLRIVNRMDEGLTYPRSTFIYPHWAVLVNKNIPEKIKHKILNTLLEIKPDSEIAISGKIKGFVPAKDYSSIKTIMKRLNVYQFKD